MRALSAGGVVVTVFLICAAVGLAAVALWTVREARAQRADDDWFYE